MPLGRVPPLALRSRHQVVCSPHTVASVVPPVLSHDRFCGTPHWRLGTGATEAWSSGLQAAQYLRSSSVDQLQVKFGGSVVCCVASAQSGVLLHIQQQTQEAVVSNNNKGVWGKKIGYV